LPVKASFTADLAERHLTRGKAMGFAKSSTHPTRWIVWASRAMTTTKNLEIRDREQRSNSAT
jgi:hypothetical protein